MFEIDNLTIVSLLFLGFSIVAVIFVNITTKEKKHIH
jgi:hypothetical protein